MALNVAFAAVLVQPFGISGLAASASLSALVEFALLVRLLDIRVVGLDRVPLRRSVGSTVIASIVMAQVVIIVRSEEHTSELQSLMRISYAVFCLKKKK